MKDQNPHRGGGRIVKGKSTLTTEKKHRERLKIQAEFQASSRQDLPIIEAWLVTKSARKATHHAEIIEVISTDFYRKVKDSKTDLLILVPALSPLKFVGITLLNSRL